MSDVLNGSINSQLSQARNVNDLAGLDKLRQAAKKHDKAALKEAATQFEAIFIQMMLKSMRKAEDVLVDKDSPFNSEQVKFYRDMHDQQLAMDMAAKGSMGLAKMLEQQLGGEDGFIPASVLRNNGDLAGARAQYQSAQAAKNNNDNQPHYSAQISRGNKQAAFGNEQEFVQRLMPIAEKVAPEYGLDPKALVAQAAVETGWGKFMIHSQQGQNGHNLFGIKADRNWQGNRTLVDTLEYSGGNPKRQLAQFRAYGSFEDSMRDYAGFVSNSSRYSNAMQSAKDPAAYFEQLQQAGYATDPQYANKVISVMDSATFKQAINGMQL